MVVHPQSPGGADFPALGALCVKGGVFVFPPVEAFFIMLENESR
tara:strand:+ start:621 stop:752 length:132 start_codon:yes stop_codon:yes gene_type:complete